MKLARQRDHSLSILAGVLVAMVILVGCGTPPEELDAAKYAPRPGDDREISTPGEQRLDPWLVAELYHHATELETIYGLLVVKDGRLIADPLYGQTGDGPWAHEKANINLVADFIDALPGR